MKIGVKYCGGCNARYDRGKIPDRLREAFPGLSIEPAQPGGEADYIVVVCGCASACAGHAHLDGRHGKTVFTGMEELPGLLGELERIKNHSKTEDVGEENI